ncbi:MAG: NYN domain-containing protein [Clostridia bacterium]|nr:NYN domain-containing protein [Clostridia bacterium]MBR2496549.1 NYN domain-containing protein [Clostridia bacterium]
MENKIYKIALLIDAENISQSYMKTIFDELAKYGDVTYKRIYGDWTNQTMSRWKTAITDYALMPIQQFQNTTSKNSSDSALIIDAMDILYSRSVDCFCIVSSDSDFTRLITRMREDGNYVIGMGEKKAPKPLVRVCDRFVYLDIVGEKEESAPSQKEKTNSKKSNAKAEVEKEKAPAKKVRRVNRKTRTLENDKIDAAMKIIDEISGDDGYANFSEVYNRLTKLYSDMDAGNYGYAKASDLFAACDAFILKKDSNGKGFNVLIRVDE